MNFLNEPNLNNMEGVEPLRQEDIFSLLFGDNETIQGEDLMDFILRRLGAPPQDQLNMNMNQEAPMQGLGIDQMGRRLPEFFN